MQKLFGKTHDRGFWQGLSDTGTDHRIRNTGTFKNGMAEATVLFAVLLAADYLFLDGKLNQISPHPFWIPVVMISFQHGLMSGFFAALAAIFLLHILGLPPQSANEDHYQYFVRVWSTPALWLGAAMVLGGLGQRQISDRYLFNNQRRKFAEEKEAIAHYCNQLQSALEGKEHETATVTASSDDSLLALLADVQKLDRTTMALGLPKVIAALFDRASFKLQGRNALDQMCPLAEGQSDGPSRPNQAALQAPPMDMAETSNDLLRTGQADAGIFADPTFVSSLNDRQTGQVLGKLEITLQDPPFDFERTQQVFRLLVHALEDTLSHNNQIPPGGRLTESDLPLANSLARLNRNQPRLVWSGAAQVKSANQNVAGQHPGN